MRRCQPDGATQLGILTNFIHFGELCSMGIDSGHHTETGLALAALNSSVCRLALNR